MTFADNMTGLILRLSKQFPKKVSVEEKSNPHKTSRDCVNFTTSLLKQNAPIYIKAFIRKCKTTILRKTFSFPA